MSVNGDNVSEASQQPVNNDDAGVFMATREEVEEYMTVISEDLDSLLRMKVHIKELARSFDALVAAGTKLPRSPNAKAPAVLQVMWIGKALDRIFAAVDAVPWNRNIINETQNRRQSLANDGQQADRSEWYDVSDDEDSQRAPSLGVNMHSTPMINRAVRDSQSGVNRDTKAEHQTVTPVPSQASAVDVLANELIKDRHRAEERRLNSDIFDKFDGNKVKFSEWMADLLRNVDKDEVPEELKLSHLKRRLTGQALKHYTKQLYRPTWRDALQHLERNYRRHQTKEQKMAIFVNREQLADENVLDYAGVLQQLCPYDDWTSRESALKARLSDGLKREDFGVRAGVSADQGRCFHDIVEELAKQEEVEEKRGKGRGPPVNRSGQVQQRESENDSWCTTCRRYTDHIASSCTQRVNRAAAGGQQGPRCFGCNGFGHKQAFCPHKARATYNNWRPPPTQQSQSNQGGWGQGSRGNNRGYQGNANWRDNGAARNDNGARGRFAPTIRALYGGQPTTNRGAAPPAVTVAEEDDSEKRAPHFKNSINVVKLPVYSANSSSGAGAQIDTEITVGGVSVKQGEYLLDTGAGCNLMSQKFAKKTGLKLEPCKQPLKDVQGGTIKCYGEVSAKVVWPGWGTQSTFHVTDVTDHEVLFGCPLMRALDMKLVGPDGKNYLGSICTSVGLVAAVKKNIPTEEGDKGAAFVFTGPEREPVVAIVNFGEEDDCEWDEFNFGEAAGDEDGDDEIVDTLALGGVEDTKPVSDEEFINGLTIGKEDGWKPSTVTAVQELLMEKRVHFGQLFTPGVCQNVEGVGRIGIEHEINTGNSPPFRMKSRRLPMAQEKAVEEMVGDLLRQGFIRESTSPWSSCVVLTKKGNGSYRLCVDYRGLNQVTVKDRFPVPRVDSLLDKLVDRSVFTTLDLKSGFYHLTIKEEDKQKTAFTALDRLFEWNVMAFGLANAPASFCRTMNQILRDQINKWVLVYMDDLLVYSTDEEEHLKHLREVITRLGDAGFKMNPTKCKFLMREVQYLGHLVSAEGLRADPEKLRAIREFPLPENKHDLRSFLGSVAYLHRYQRNMSAATAPLQAMIAEAEARNKSKSAKVEWNDERKKLFEELRVQLSTTPTLIFPRVGETYFVTTDASTVGMGCVLEQEREGMLRAIAFGSKPTSKAEKKYCATELEARAIVYALSHFNSYVSGEEVIVFTDHKPLSALFLKEIPSARLHRWCQVMQQYDVTIKYKPGKHNVLADALSRAPVPVKAVVKNEEDEREKLIKWHHEGQFAYHASANKTFQRMAPFYQKNWPSLKKDIEEYVKKCNVCSQRNTQYEKLQYSPRPPPSQPREVWSIDFSEFRSGNRVPHCLVMIDNFSRMIFARACRQADGAAVVKSLGALFAQFGVPKEIISDQGRHFRCKEVQNFLADKGVSHKMCTPYAKNSNAVVERANRTLQDALAKKLKTMGRSPERWHEMLQDAVQAYNVTPHSSLGGRSPFEVQFGAKFSSTAAEFETEPVNKDFWEKVRGDMVRAQEAARGGSSKKVVTRFEAGQPVYVRDTASMNQRTAKLDMPNALEATIVHVGRRSAKVQLKSGKIRDVPLSSLQPRHVDGREEETGVEDTSMSQ